LPGDLIRAGTTPAFSWISPNLCDDGHDAPCVTGAPGGLAQADAFLAQWVPKIMAAPAYRDGGLIEHGSASADVERPPAITVTAPAWTGSSRVRGARTNHDADVRSTVALRT
jgi:hypothetical protein